MEMQRSDGNKGQVSFSFARQLALYDALDLEEASQPPNLEDRLANDNAEDEKVPPLDACVGALGGVAVGAFAHDDVLLLVLDLGKEVGEFADCRTALVSTTC